MHVYILLNCVFGINFILSDDKYVKIFFFKKSNTLFTLSRRVTRYCADAYIELIRTLKSMLYAFVSELLEIHDGNITHSELKCQVILMATTENTCLL